MKHLGILAFLAFFASSALAQDQSQMPPDAPPQGWYQQQSGTNAIISNLFFLNRDTGWADASDGLYGTTNGGDNWVLLSTGIGRPYFIDAYNGIAEGDTSMVRTTDGGKHWQHFGTRKPIGGLAQYFGMDTIRIFKSESFAGSNDGGKTWYTDDTSEAMTHSQQGRMSFPNSQYGFLGGMDVRWFLPYPPAYGTDGAGFAITTDGGKNWHAKYSSVQDGFDAIFAVDERHIYTAGGRGIYHTSNGGNTWDSLYNLGGLVSDFYFINNSRGYFAGGFGAIYFTNDTGKTWVRQNSSVTTDLNNVYFIDSLTGWACGDEGVILHTINGGLSWVRQYLPFDSIITQTYPEPANGNSLSFHYTIPFPEHISISLYDLTGSVVQTFIRNDYESQGEHTIPITLSPQLVNGVYYYLFQTEKYQSTGKITILR